ncbi:hypothetical protein QA641_15065 [Bradyrhizobium sp. CB1650]|nr:hypothetical protein [Bradyrhizobium sp. CB1650]WGD55095.1 hypothetical protein QA641_15065 [Bradyrhizobium sp. CB1650]
MKVGTPHTCNRPTKFDLATDMKTAKALGFTVPPYLLASADELIE